MNSDDSSRNMHYSPNRKPVQPKSQVYSPSTNYNYNGNQSQHGNHGNQNFGNQQRPHRKPSQFKRDFHGSSDRLAKQNDVIIRLLKEIRDRLPAPEVVPGEVEEPVQDQPAETADVQQNAATEEINEQQEEGAPAASEETVAVPSAVSDEELDQQVNGNI